MLALPSHVSPPRLMNRARLGFHSHLAIFLLCHGHPRFPEGKLEGQCTREVGIVFLEYSSSSRMFVNGLCALQRPPAFTVDAPPHALPRAQPVMAANRHPGGRLPPLSQAPLGSAAMSAVPCPAVTVRCRVSVGSPRSPRNAGLLGHSADLLPYQGGNC